ncbi:endonuclease domain-containing protein [Candidatus Uabimicrobium sp. HlEnr_7]|uniref:endonuclease domain-containing protein n=1 Tax=Candidatus Uabimicrobium helgolandensis TaxID=3095367 RepID=UPI00355865EE
MNTKLKHLVRKIRKNSTAAENILWKELRNKRQGSTFRKQHSFPSYVVAFYCYEKRIIVEIDDQIRTPRSLYNHAREKQLTREGFIILRFTNVEICRDLESVMKKIREKL